jgi:hypothetical protein
MNKAIDFVMWFAYEHTDVFKQYYKEFLELEQKKDYFDL